MLNRIEEQFLIASIGEKTRAREAWELLISSTEFAEIQNEYLRFLPRIYWNLRSMDNVSYFAQLRGVYRHSWSKNIVGLTQAQILIDGLQNYRILKGFGITLTTGNLGIRSMGDLDLLVSKKSHSRLLQNLNESGFTPIFNVGCISCTKTRWRNDTQTWINTDGLQIDLHVPGAKVPTKLFQHLIETPSNTRYFRGRPFQVPQIEDLIAHSIIHGLNGSKMDFLQSCIDVYELTRLLSIGVSQCNISSKVDIDDANVVYEILKDLAHESMIYPSTNTPVANLNKTSFKDFSLRHIFSHIRNRTYRTRDLVKAGRVSSNIRNSFIYRIWVFSGRLRPLESRVLKHLGGFMKTNSSAYYPAEFLGEVRLKVSALKFKEVVISRRKNSQTCPTRFLVFLDADLAGIMEDEDRVRIRLHESLKQVSEHEISIRKPHRSCLSCSGKILQEEIQIELVEHS